MEITALEFIAICICWFCFGISVKGCIDARRKHSTKEEVTIEGWVTRDKDYECATLWDIKPIRNITRGYWNGYGECLPLPESSFPEVTWDSDPKKVSVTIKAE